MSEDAPEHAEEPEPEEPEGYVRQRVREATVVLEAAFNDRTWVTPYATGLSQLDWLLGGFRRGTLSIIGGRPSSGKTSLALRFVAQCALSHRPTILLSPSTAAVEVTNRLLACDSRIDVAHLRRGYVQNGEWQPLAAAAGALAASSLIIDDSPRMDIEFIVDRVERAAAEGFVAEVVVLDDIQSLTLAAEMDTRVAETGSLAKKLKRFAREKNIVFVGVSTVNRSAEKSPGFRPRISDLRDSGDIEDMADQVMLLFFEENYLRGRTPEDRLGMLEIEVAKNRFGPLGVVEARWFTNIGRIDNIDREPAPAET